MPNEHLRERQKNKAHGRRFLHSSPKMEFCFGPPPLMEKSGCKNIRCLYLRSGRYSRGNLPLRILLKLETWDTHLDHGNSKRTSRMRKQLRMVISRLCGRGKRMGRGNL